MKSLTGGYPVQHPCELDNRAEDGTTHTCYINCDGATFSWNHPSELEDQGFLVVVLCSVGLGLTVCCCCWLCVCNRDVLFGWIWEDDEPIVPERDEYGRVARNDYTTDTDNDQII